MKTFFVIGRGKHFPITIRKFNRRSIVDMLAGYSLVFHEWKHFGFMILDNF